MPGPDGAAEAGAPSADAPAQKKNPIAVYLASLHRLSMRRALDRAVAFFTDHDGTDAMGFDWSQINVEQVQKLRSVMVARGRAAGTVNHMLSGIRSTVRIAWDDGQVDDKTRIAIEDLPNEKPQQRRRSGRYVKRGEVLRLFAALGTDEIGARDAAMLTLLYGAGLKRSEAAALQLADYDQASGVITVRPDERQVYATNGGKEAIDAWLARRGFWPGALLCPVAKGGRIQRRDITDQAVMMRVGYLAKQAGVEAVTPNDLRRTYLIEGLAPMMLSVPYQAP